jgi:hypothetical protein
MAEVVFFLGSYGLTFLVCDATIFSTPRQFLFERSPLFQALVSCYFCTGFWTSAAWYVLLFSGLLDGHSEAQNWPVNAVWGLAHALAGAAFVYALNAAVVALEGVEYLIRAKAEERFQDEP